MVSEHVRYYLCSLFPSAFSLHLQKLTVKSIGENLKNGSLSKSSFENEGAKRNIGRNAHTDFSHSNGSLRHNVRSSYLFIYFDAIKQIDRKYNRVCVRERRFVAVLWLANFIASLDTNERV